MKFREYVEINEKYFYGMSDKRLFEQVNEIIDLSTKVSLLKSSGNTETWYFKVGSDLYYVTVTEESKDRFEVMFGMVSGKEVITSLTDKNIPFKVLDGVAVVIKRLIDNKKPKEINFTIVAEEKKSIVFYKVIQKIIHKYFKDYNTIMKDGNYLPKDVLGYNVEKIIKIKGVK